MTNTSLVQVHQLEHRYGERLVIDHLDITLQSGEVLGFLGPNGAGKSTTLNILTGNLRPSGGTVLIHGVDMHRQPQLAKKHLGYLPEHPPLYRDLTTQEYLRYAAQLHGLQGKLATSAVQSVLKKCDLSSVAKRVIGSLSKGYQQRIGIAQAIIHQPEVILLDEPTVGLDPKQIQEIRTLIQTLSQEHAILLSSHILPEIQAVCSRVQIIHQGRSVYSEKTDILSRAKTSDSVQVLFQNPPPMQALHKLPGVHWVEQLQVNEFRLHHEPDTAITDMVMRESLAQDWQLLQISPVYQTLEQVFIELTCQDQSKPTESTLSLQVSHQDDLAKVKSA